MPPTEPRMHGCVARTKELVWAALSVSETYPSTEIGQLIVGGGSSGSIDATIPAPVCCGGVKLVVCSVTGPAHFCVRLPQGPSAL